MGADRYRPVLQRRWCLDQGSWNRLLLDTALAAEPIPEGEVQFPLYLQPKYRDYTKAALVHTLGAHPG
ncbi:MAG: hypothetical protein R3F11_14800 [Verrucomicrobiales bacterium]